MCSKRTYTKAEAKKCIKRLLAGGDVQGGLAAYKCPECGWWHVGHSSWREKNRRLHRRPAR